METDLVGNGKAMEEYEHNKDIFKKKFSQLEEDILKKE